MVGLEFWLFFFFFLLWLVPKGRGEYGWIGIGEKKNQGFFQVAAMHALVGGCSEFGLVVGEWEREKNGEMENRDEERRETDFFFYIILLCNLYYFNMLYIL